MSEAPEVAFEVPNDDGAIIAGAYPHPRMPSMWLAVVPPRDWRESGLKKFKTRRGAIAFVERRLAEGRSP